MGVADEIQHKRWLVMMVIPCRKAFVSPLLHAKCKEARGRGASQDSIVPAWLTRYQLDSAICE